MNTHNCTPSTWLRAIALAAVLPFLAACDQVSEKIDQKIEQAVPKATAAQNEQAAKLYQALSQKDYALIMQAASPEFQADLKQSSNSLAFMSSQIPTGSAPAAPSMIAINKSVHNQRGKLLSITYQYVYPVQLVNFTVVYDGEEGSTVLKGLNLNVQVNPNTPAPSSTAPSSASAPKQQVI